MNLLKTSALAAASTGSLSAMAPSLSYAQWPNVLEAKAISDRESCPSNRAGLAEDTSFAFDPRSNILRV
jgi:hypothetical protein